MQVVGAFMALNIVWWDVEKYKLKWLRVLECVRGLGFNSYVCHVCVVCFIINFNDILSVRSDNITLYL